MFKDKAFQVKVVHTDPTPTRSAVATRESSWTPDQILNFGKEAVKTFVVAAAVLYGVKVTLDTTKEIAVKRTKSN